MDKIKMVLDKVLQHSDFKGLESISVNSANAYGNFPIHIVSGWKDSQAVLQLIESGADINIKGEYGLTPLHYAVEQNDISTVRVLVCHGALNIADEWGTTPVMLAEDLKYAELLEYLKSSFLN